MATLIFAGAVMNMKFIIINIIFLSFVSSVVLADSYFINSTGGDWSIAENWNNGIPGSADTAYIGAQPASPNGAWATLSTSTPYVMSVIVGMNGSGTLDITDDANIMDANGLITAVGSGSVANINVSGGKFLDRLSISGSYLPDAPPMSQWAVDGTMNYTQTAGYVFSRLNHCAINPGSVLNIKITGGVLDMGGRFPAELDPNWQPTPLNGQMNVDISGEGYVILKAVDSDPANYAKTKIKLNGNGKLVVYGDRTADPSLNGRVTTKGTLVAKKASYGPFSGYIWTETLITTECNSPVAGDINSDCSVDMNDLLLFSNSWLAGN
jgi:hypothetical protein